MQIQNHLLPRAETRKLTNKNKKKIIGERIKMADVEKLGDQISELSLLEAAELTKYLEEKLGVSAAAPVAVAAAAAGPAARHRQKARRPAVGHQPAQGRVARTSAAVRKLPRLSVALPTCCRAR